MIVMRERLRKRATTFRLSAIRKVQDGEVQRDGEEEEEDDGCGDSHRETGTA